MASIYENRFRRMAEMAGTDGQSGSVPVLATPSVSGNRTLAAGTANIELEAQNRGASVMRALRPFHRALANRASAPCDILFVGHSFIEGVGASSYNKTLPALFRDALRARFPNSAGIVGGYGFMSANGFFSPGDKPLVSSGGSTNNNYGIGRRGWQFSAANQKVSGSVVATGFDIHYTQNTTTGTLYYKIDGGTATTVATNGALAPGQVIPIRGLSVGSHAIEVGWSSGGAVVTEGLMIYNGDETAGIRVWNGGLGSQQTTGFLSATNWFSSITPVQPALVVICLMANNFGGAAYTPVSSAQTKADLKTLIANIRAKCTVAPAIVLCIEYERQDNTSNAVETWDAYRQAAYEVASEDTCGPESGSGVAIFEMQVLFGRVPAPRTANDLVSADNVHPTSIGYEGWSQALVSFVSPA